MTNSTNITFNDSKNNLSSLDKLNPSRVRYRITFLMCGLAAITYMDRVCIATLAPNIMSTFDLSKIEMGYIFSAFALAYAIFEIPTARFADKIGSHSIIARIVLFWSILTIATGAAFNFLSMLIIRFLFGAGEAGAWPCSARTFARWIPRKERGIIQACFFSCAFIAGALTPLLVTFLVNYISWRSIFFIFGFIGFVWVIIWCIYATSEPSDHPSVNSAELDLISQDRPVIESHTVGIQFWRKLFLNKNIILLCVLYLPNSFLFYFCITWLPTYLEEIHHFSAKSLSFFSGLPLLLSVFGVILGGILMDRITERFGPRAGRCGLGATAYLIAAISLAIVPYSHGLYTAGILIAVAMAANTFTLSAAWGACIDIGKDHSGVVSATMNSASQIGSFLSPLVVAYSLKWFATWNVSILLMSLLFVVGAFSWLKLDLDSRIDG